MGVLNLSEALMIIYQHSKSKTHIYVLIPDKVLLKPISLYNTHHLDSHVSNQSHNSIICDGTSSKINGFKVPWNHLGLSRWSGRLPPISTNRQLIRPLVWSHWFCCARFWSHLQFLSSIFYLPSHSSNHEPNNIIHLHHQFQSLKSKNQPTIFIMILDCN